MRRCLQCSAQPGPNWICKRCGHAPVSQLGYPLFAPQLAQRTDDYDPAYFQQLYEVEPGSFWFRSRNQLIALMIRRYAPAARTVLEIGCGTGFTLQAITGVLPQARITATDVFPEAFAFASTRAPSAEFLQLDITALPFVSEFDLVCAFDVLEHVEDDRAALEQVHASLQKGGLMILTVPQHQALWSSADEIAHHKRRYSRRELEEKLAHAGFEILRTTSFVSLLMPALLLTPRKPKTHQEAVKQLALPRVLSAALGAVMSVERILIRVGVNFPFGSSRLAVARAV